MAKSLGDRIVLGPFHEKPLIQFRQYRMPYSYCNRLNHACPQIAFRAAAYTGLGEDILGVISSRKFSLTHRKTDRASRSTFCRTVNRHVSVEVLLCHEGGVDQIRQTATDRLSYSFLCACYRHELRNDVPLSSTWRHIEGFARKHTVKE